MRSYQLTSVKRGTRAEKYKDSTKHDIFPLILASEIKVVHN